MSNLKFDGAKHEIALIGEDGREIGRWVAYNNVDSHASLRFIPNGTYAMKDTVHSHPHRPDPNGPYGSYGILRFDVPHHVGIGVHSGRALSKYLPGPLHPTMGCIRTTDQAMRAITLHIVNDPLRTIEVKSNADYSAKKASAMFSKSVFMGLAWA
ncbi:MAG TPA: hypothetical protein VFX23_00420 [Limnobacter sp.]|uniref:hypothetical protein n=1 Tax=Limnobacter sp. TaxID=2003368 RepID=UPI002E2FFD4C|nr:hypothetical protein [Limnobacter sp.]HEX5484435.1 hypothetical protein [Limnobacter sp.]